MREGFFDFNDIAYGILETNGAFSVLPKGSQRPVVAEDFQNIPIEQASVAAYPIVDGEVSQYALGQLDRDEKWLFKKLGVRSKRELKGILLAVYDEKLDKFDVHYKDSRRNRNTNNQASGSPRPIMPASGPRAVAKSIPKRKDLSGNGKAALIQ